MFFTGLVRIGNDPVLRFTPRQEPVIDLSLAYNYGRKDETGKFPTQWISATLWGARAEKLSPYLTKGKQLYVALNDIHNETYDRKDGGQGTKLCARVTELQFVDTRQEEPKEPVKPKAKPTFDDLDDDIPY